MIGGFPGRFSVVAPLDKVVGRGTESALVEDGFNSKLRWGVRRKGPGMRGGVGWGVGGVAAKAQFEANREADTHGYAGGAVSRLGPTLGDMLSREA